MALLSVHAALTTSPALAYFVRALVYREGGEYVKALVETEKAVALDPNYANGHVLHAILLYYAGRPEQGLEKMQKAIQLNPRHPYNYPFHLGQAYFMSGEYRRAISAFRQGLDTNPASERLRVWLAAAYAQAGETGEAKWQLEQVLLVNPAFSTARLQRAFPFAEPADRERFFEGLRKAGLAGEQDAGRIGLRVARVACPGHPCTMGGCLTKHDGEYGPCESRLPQTGAPGEAVRLRHVIRHQVTRA